jgi:glycosyltransferase involved in cell wall biosynthesis
MIISVVIPARNEEQSIQNCIEHVYGNILPDNTQLEVTVVDGLSTDNTAQIVNDLKQKYHSLHLVLNHAQTTPVAFNLGINNSKGDYVTIVGARQYLSKTYFQEIIQSFQIDNKIKCVGGSIHNIFTNKTSRYIALAMNSPFGVGGGNFRVANSSSFVDTVGTPMYHKSTFEEFGLFDENLVRNQDDEYNFRLTSAGYKIYQNIDATTEYRVRASFKNLKKQYYQYGYWKVYVNKKVKTVTTIRQLFPAILVLAIVIGAILAIFNKVFLYLWLAGIGSYILLSIFFAFQKSVKIKAVMNVLLAFYILHFSYGLGYLKGILDFVVLSKGPTNKNATLSR